LRNRRGLRVLRNNGRATSALFFGKARARLYSFRHPHNEGSGAPQGATELSVPARHGGVSCDRDATPCGAPHAAFLADHLRRNSGPRFLGRGRLSVPCPSPASSSQSGRNAARAESRSRPSAWLRATPAGAAPRWIETDPPHVAVLRVLPPALRRISAPPCAIGSVLQASLEDAPRRTGRKKSIRKLWQYYDYRPIIGSFISGLLSSAPGLDSRVRGSERRWGNHQGCIAETRSAYVRASGTLAFNSPCQLSPQARPE
jgi:hypothetical protein